ncbi:N-acetylmuramoyl-L-alanine amidase [Marilutibacter spongiae]|uniref:N-acetylmuramoyl-L-alanine amidase n=1 Tax=Marilutibacter spongiae TaxID=2025720 RepID=A0A7W3TMR8_9GAMM|nr:N-acetylmuramoyl-L-alanine amidase [Lysobacter spongiae]MBB1061218.1 N-acetylmuramoyl-L-alanine amidase [Lysobacter spongiae]
MRLIRPVFPRGLLVAALACALLAACASAPPRNPLAEWRGSPNHDVRRARLVVLHHTDMESAEAALHTLQTGNAGGPVSAHYLVGRDGRLYQLVPEQLRAWHAGAGRWQGQDDLNSASIGIEIDNDGHSPFPDAQLEALLRLLEDIVARTGIPRAQVIGHADLAPARKRDPSAVFPWARLAEAGFGLWPRAAPAPAPDDFDPWRALRLVGYDLADPEAARCAFQRHFRAHECTLEEDGHMARGAWRPGDFDILHDLERQRLGRGDRALPGLAPAPDDEAAASARATRGGGVRQ